jgi:hypothetical protein
MVAPYGGYSRDAHAIYFLDREVPGADPGSFAAVSDSVTMDGRDKNRGYLSGQPID